MYIQYLAMTYLFVSWQKKSWWQHPTPLKDGESSWTFSHGTVIGSFPLKNGGVPQSWFHTEFFQNREKNLLRLRSCQALIEAPGYYVHPSLLLGWLSQSASWVIFEVTGLCTPTWCRWAHPHSGPSRNSFIRPSEWPHSSPSPQLVTLRLCRGPRTNFSLFPLPDLPRTTHLSHASLLLRSMWWLELQGSSLAANCLRPPNRWNVVEMEHTTDFAVIVRLNERYA